MTRPAYTGVTRATWLFMLKEGGRWRPSELSRELQEAGSNCANVPSMLRSMVDNGQAQRFGDGRQGRGSRGVYGVTPDCTMPQGVTLRDLADAGALNLGNPQ